MSDPGFAWWRQGDSLCRLLADAVRGQFLVDHPDAMPPPLPWAPDFDFTETLGADSLDRLAAATAVSAQLRIDRSGLDDALLARRTLGDWAEVAQLALERYSETLQVRSSGSQGVPRWHPHRLARLVDEVMAVAALFPPRRRIVALVPAHHIYGLLFTILFPARLELPVWDARIASPGAVVGRLDPGDLIVAHPHWWSLVAQSGAALPPAIGLTATAPCPAAVGPALRAAGLTALIELYGSSETAGVGWRAAGAEHFTLLPTWQHGADGSLRDDLGAEAELPDFLSWQDRTLFQVLGRKDGQVQVAGVNVDLAEVRRVLMAVPGVAALALRLAASGRLKAFIVPAPGVGGAVLRPQLQAVARAHLPVPARPASWTFGTALPLTPAGKPGDWLEAISPQA